jgi:hypothetical protein
MSRRGLGRVLLMTLTVVAALAVTGVANAYWRASGTGTGSGTAGTTVAVTLTPGAPTPGLYPGGATAVVLTVTNTNTSAVRLGTLSLDISQGTGGFAVDAGHSGCLVSALSFTTQTNGGAGWTVPAKVGAVNGTLAITLPNALAMTTTAANACQSATSTVYLVAGP